MVTSTIVRYRLPVSVKQNPVNLKCVCISFDSSSVHLSKKLVFIKESVYILSFHSNMALYCMQIAGYS